MPILCEPAELAGELTFNIGGTVRATDNLVAAAQLLTDDPAETLVVIGPEVAVDDALTFSATLRTDRPNVGVVLVRHKVDIQLLTMALRAGIREVVSTDNLSVLTEACTRSRELSRVVVPGSPADGGEPTREGEVVTVFAAKGGCGKTTLAVNLSAVLAAGGTRRVCLVDLDLAFGDVAITMQLDPAHTIVDGLAMVGHLDATGAASLLTPYRPGLDVLLAPVQPGDAEKIPPAFVSELLGVLRRMYDYVVVDTPSQFSEHVLTAMDASTHHVLLTTPDVAALKNLRVTLDMLDLLSYPRDIRSVVLNRADSKVGLTAEDVERVIRTPLAGHVPSSREVPTSANRGTPIAVANPGHPVSAAIARFSGQHLYEQHTPVRKGPLARLRLKGWQQ
jgi:pilus assembly protein CpaE